MVARTDLRKVCNIMLLMTTQLCEQSVTHWQRNANAPIAITSGSSRKSATMAGANAKHNTLTTSRNAADTRNLELHLDEVRHSVEIQAAVSCAGRTGVEMEALTAVSTAALTVYDMCKAVQKDMVITDIRLVSKTGGVHGDYERKDES